MLELYLLRHGKATKYTSESTDFERHLNKQGTAQINQIGYRLKNEFPGISQIISSTAQRTTETSEIVNFYLEVPKINFFDELYLANYDTILTSLCKEAKAEKVLYVGHNNGISDLASYLANERILLSTGELIILQFELDNWELLSGGLGIIKNQIKPKIKSF